MDGVLADFGKKARQQLDLPEDTDILVYKKAIGKESFWSQINQNPNFFLELDPIPDDIRKVWKNLESMFEHIAILSSPSYSIKLCIPNKNTWLDKHIGPGGLRIYEKEKHLYACPRSVLIDDLEKNILPWRKAGGIAIHFKGQFDDAFWDELSAAKETIKVRTMRMNEPTCRLCSHEPPLIVPFSPDGKHNEPETICRLCAKPLPIVRIGPDGGHHVDGNVIHHGAGL